MLDGPLINCIKLSLLGCLDLEVLSPSPCRVTNQGQQGGEEQQGEADQGHHTAVSGIEWSCEQKFKLIIRQSNGCIRAALYKIRIN